jgi:hypothetical protein
MTQASGVDCSGIRHCAQPNGGGSNFGPSPVGPDSGWSDRGRGKAGGGDEV